MSKSGYEIEYCSDLNLKVFISEKEKGNLFNEHIEIDENV